MLSTFGEILLHFDDESNDRTSSEYIVHLLLIIRNRSLATLIAQDGVTLFKEGDALKMERVTF
jgi:hypothetical protein